MPMTSCLGLSDPKRKQSKSRKKSGNTCKIRSSWKCPKPKRSLPMREQRQRTSWGTKSTHFRKIANEVETNAEASTEKLDYECQRKSSKKNANSTRATGSQGTGRN